MSLTSCTVAGAQNHVLANMEKNDYNSPSPLKCKCIKNSVSAWRFFAGQLTSHQSCAKKMALSNFYDGSVRFEHRSCNAAPPEEKESNHPVPRDKDNNNGRRREFNYRWIELLIDREDPFCSFFPSP